MRNLGAALVAIVCWAGLAVQFAATFGHQHHLIPTIWILLRFFTIVTNLLLAIMMTWVAVGRNASAFLLGGATLAILLVGVIYVLMLEGLVHLSGAALIADVLLHKISPIMMAVWWLFFAPRAKLRWNAPIWWAAYPVAYLIYVLARGHMDGRYPYPFLDVGRLGWLQTALNVGGIALGFILAGFALVWIDSWRPLGSSRGSR
ncbi:MAG: Pr6Pr family membrane protein [Sphingomicrobium sp.]